MMKYFLYNIQPLRGWHLSFSTPSTASGVIVVKSHSGFILIHPVLHFLTIKNI